MSFKTSGIENLAKEYFFHHFLSYYFIDGFPDCPPAHVEFGPKGRIGYADCHHTIADGWTCAIRCNMIAHNQREGIASPHLIKFALHCALFEAFAKDIANRHYFFSFHRCCNDKL